LIEIANASEENLVRKVAVVHDMFEQIHPFPDGNGRVGRIIMNFMLVGHGLPNIAIKGSEKNKKIYIDSLEDADPIVAEILSGRKAKDPFGKPLIQLEDVINKSLASALDIIICNRYDKIKKLISLKDAAAALGKPLTSLSVACSQKKHICTKIDGGIKTHPDLFKLPE
jgi:Fic family protein